MSVSSTAQSVRAVFRSRPAATRDGLVIGIAVGLAGVAFGAAATSAGMNLAQAMVLSVVGFTGASQLALAGAVAGGGNLVAAVVGALLLGSRNTLYGLQMVDLLGVRRWSRKPLLAHALIDDTVAVAMAQSDRAGRLAAFTAAAGSTLVVWNGTTLLGVLGARAVPDPGVLGLDVISPAVFLALLWPWLSGSLTDSGNSSAVVRRVAGVAALIALATTPLLPSGVPVLLAASAALLGLVGSR